MAIIAIDPGTRNTGLVYMNELAILDAETIKFNDTVKNDQYALMVRSHEIVQRIYKWLQARPHDWTVIEGFVNYSKRQSGYTFQTPYLCGYIHAALATEHFIVQTSRQVLNPRTKGNVAAYRDAMERGEEVWGDCKLLTNDHTRSAACHGIYYYLRREGE